MSQVKRIPRSVDSESPRAELWGERVTLRKTVSVDDTFLQQTPREHHRLLSRLERGKKKLRNIHVSSSIDKVSARPENETEKVKKGVGVTVRSGWAI